MRVIIPKECSLVASTWPVTPALALPRCGLRIINIAIQFQNPQGEINIQTPGIPKGSNRDERLGQICPSKDAFIPPTVTLLTLQQIRNATPGSTRHTP